MRAKLIIAIDPGNLLSAVVVYSPLSWAVLEHGKVFNRDLVREMSMWARAGSRLVIEMLGHYGTGMSVGKEVFRTALWLGRFIEKWGDDATVDLVLRKSAASHLCGSVTAKDSNIRQAVIDRFGGDAIALGYQKCAECGGSGGHGRGKARVSCASCGGEKRTAKGPLYDLIGDEWQALGLALAYSEGVKVIPPNEWLGYVPSSAEAVAPSRDGQRDLTTSSNPAPLRSHEGAKAEPEAMAGSDTSLGAAASVEEGNDV